MLWRRGILLLGAAFTLSCKHYVVTESDFYEPWKKTLPPVSDGLQRTNAELTTADGATLKGWLITSPGSRRAILFFNGNQISIAQSAGELMLLASVYDADVLCFDHRGVGFTEAAVPAGASAFVTLESDALAAYDFFRGQEADRDILVFGYSLGTVLATHVAAVRPVAGVVLRAPGTSVDDMIDAFTQHVPWYLRPFVRIEPDAVLAQFHPQPIEDIQKVTAPLLVIHGTADENIPFELGRKMYEAAASQKKRLCPIDGASHDDVDFYRRRVRACMDESWGPLFGDKLAPSPR